MVVRIRSADHKIPSTPKAGTTSPDPAVVQSVYFACGLKATEFVFVFCFYDVRASQETCIQASTAGYGDSFTFL
jgi:hypothetical protein